jgi:phenylalanyl-tRNA synthetase beta chain
MKFSWDWIKELSQTSLSAEAAAELLSSKAFEVEGVEGDVFDIKILPNRPDCLSHIGIARELCALEGRRFIAPSYEYATGTHPAVSVEIRDTQGCPRFSALVMRDVQVGPSPDWLKERLGSSGLRSINNVVDVTNYVMLELGQPMHAFELSKVDRIIVRPAEEGEQLKALDEAQTEYPLDGSILVVADSSKPLSIAGIKGGADSGISHDTHDILLEAANWQPQSIRAASRKLGLKTDASTRFTYGVDPNLTAPALMRAAELLIKVAQARTDGDIVDAYPHPVKERTIALDPIYTRSLLGIEIGEGQMRAILESLGFEVADDHGKLLVTVPTRRLDVSEQEDLIEEVGRLYGFEAIPAAAPVLPIYSESAWVAEESDSVAWDELSVVREREHIGRLLAGAGYAEVYNYAFLSDELKALLRSEASHELQQPQSSEYRWLRTSLVPRLLVNARDNLRFFDEIKLFETGHVFDHVVQGKESARLGLLVAARTSRPESAQEFYELKGAIDLVLQRLGVGDYYYDDAGDLEWAAEAVGALASGSRACIRLEGSGKVIGCVGMVSGRITETLKLKGVAAVAELDLRVLIAHAQQEREFEPLPKYPAIIRDIAIMVDQGVKIDDIIQTVHDADAAGLIQDVDVFDIFLPTGKEKIKEEGDTPAYGKSVAFHVIFRASDRTLRDDEVAVAETAIKVALQENLGAQIR